MVSEKLEPVPKKKRGRLPVAGTPVKKLIPEEEMEALAIDDGPNLNDVADQERLENLREQFGGHQHVIRVQKYNEETSELELVDRYEFDSFDPFLVQRRFGGGKYICSLYNEEGRYVTGGRFRFNFAKTIAVPEPTSPLHDPMVQMMLAQSEKNTTVMIEMVKTMMTGQKQTPLGELAAALKTVQDMNPKSKEMDPMKSLKDLMEIQIMMKEASGESDEKSPGIMSEVLEAFKMLQAGKQVRAPMAGGVNRGVGPRPLMGSAIVNNQNGGLPIIPKPEVLMPELIPPVKNILFYTPKFVQAAEQNKSPEKWASFLLDILDEETVPELVAHYGGIADEDYVWERLIAGAEDPEKVNKIFLWAPALEPHKEWVTKVLQAALKQVDEEPSNEETPIGTTLNGETL